MLTRVLIRLLETYDMRALFKLNMEGLQDSLHQFQMLLSKTCPQLDAHFNRLSIHPSLYATQWYLSLFACSAPSEHLMRIYDIALLEGTVETVTRAALLLLQKNEKSLLSMSEHDQVLHYLTSDKIYKVCPAADVFACDIISVSIMLQPTRIHSQQEQNNRALLALHFQTNKQQQTNDKLAQLEKENAVLKQENKSLKMHEMDQEAAQSKLAKRNAILKKCIKKYKVKLANATVTSEANTMPTLAQQQHQQQQQEQVSPVKQQDQYSSFVASLRDTGEFGALIAGALAPKLISSDSEITVDEEPLEDEDENQKKLDAALQNVTSELVAVKLQNFETNQRYETLYSHCEELTSQLQSMQEEQTAMAQKIIYLQSELEDVQTERDQIYQDQEQVLAMAMVAKKTAAELQLEKMDLVKDVERLEQGIKELEQEKQAFFMPRGTFSEEVFAAHSILFGSTTTATNTTTTTTSTSPKKPLTKETRRHTLQLGYKPVIDDEYKTKFVESELRCRELEKYLAETKVKLAEFESTVGMSSSCSIISPRASLHQQRRASCYNNKRSSTASLSMLANRVSTPTSPRERRLSTDSYASTNSMTSMTSSNYNTSSKRSSVYSRIWNAFGAPTTPVNPVAPVSMKEEGVLMCEEPQIIQQ
jgi:predicted nuclease with TOPRIM domain